MRLAHNRELHVVAQPQLSIFWDHSSMKLAEQRDKSKCFTDSMVAVRELLTEFLQLPARSQWSDDTEPLSLFFKLLREAYVVQ